MSKKAGIAFVAMGAVLIFSALLLLFYNVQEDETAGKEAESVMSELEAIIADRITETDSSAESDTSSPPETDRDTSDTDVDTDEAPPAPDEKPILSPELPVVDVNGYGYIGYIEFPTLDVKLPIMADWDYDRLKIAPCRQFGSSRTDDLVIAGHNYSKHFGKLWKLSVGNTVVFTDTDGIVNVYAVAKMSRLKPENVDTVKNSGYDLAIYTCTSSGQTRLVIFCNRVEK